MSTHSAEQLSNTRLARQAAQRHGVPVSLFLNQIRQESGFQSHVVSKAGARGVAQIMPATAHGWGVDPDDPAAALDAAARNMAKYKEQFGSWQNALVAYNAGPGAVGRALPAETRNYIEVIMGHGAANEPTAARTAAGTVKTNATAPKITPGTTQVDDDAALIDALLNHRGGSLLKRYQANVDTGNYTTTTDAKVTPGKVTTTAPPAKPSSVKGATAPIKGGSHVLELIYNDGGSGFGIKDGKTVNGSQVFGAVWDGHKNHVHVAAGPETVVRLGKLAQSMGLHVGENSHFGGVSQGEHAANSYHYKGEAIDVSGDAALMKKYAQTVAKYNASRTR